MRRFMRFNRNRSALRYNVFIRLLHALIASGILLQLVIGFFRHRFYAFWPRKTLMMLHQSIGLTLLVLVILLIVTRLFSRKIPYPSGDMPLYLVVFAKLVHFGLYVCILLMALSGLVAFQLFHHSWQYFDLFSIPNLLVQNPRLGHEIFMFHPVVANVLMALVILHVLGSFYHRVIRKDNVVKRMC